MSKTCANGKHANVSTVYCFLTQTVIHTCKNCGSIESSSIAAPKTANQVEPDLWFNVPAKELP